MASPRGIPHYVDVVAVGFSVSLTIYEVGTTRNSDYKIMAKEYTRRNKLRWRGKCQPASPLMWERCNLL